MELPIFQVDAFTDAVFQGNPAAVMPLPSWLDDTILQAIAKENNLSETAFLVARGQGFDLRWFTPARLAPDYARLLAASDYPVIATAPGDNCDFVSRFFGPQVGINEDPVTGSAHCSLVPYWAGRLHLDTLQARQISARGGTLVCSLHGERVAMTGRGVTFMRGEVLLPL